MVSLTGKVIILNSPPNTGKDSIANAICNIHTHTKHRQFKDKLYEITAMLFNRNLLSFKHAANDRVLKETPSENLTVPSKEFHKITALTKSNRAFTIAEGCTLSGDYNVPISPREALIYTSEIVIKPRFGDKYFGLAAADSIRNDRNGSVFSDGGFQEELSPIVDVVGEENVYIVQFTRGDKLNFLGDSRDWLEPYGNINLIQTTNDGTIDEVVDYILSQIKQ